MTFDIIWDWPALTVLYDIHWRAGGSIDAAVMRFAKARAATLPPAPLYHLPVAGYDVILIVDRAGHTVTVFRIYRRR